MEEEFDLSKEILEDELFPLIPMKKVKEFIKRLKEEVNEYWTNGEGQCICPECWEHRKGTKEDYKRTNECMFLRIFKEIDKLAGDKLIEEKGE